MQNICTKRTIVVASSKRQHNADIENFLIEQSDFVIRRTDEAVVLWSWVERGLGDCIITDARILDGNMVEFFNLVKSVYGDNRPGIILINENNLLSGELNKSLVEQENVLFMADSSNLKNIMDQVQKLFRVGNSRIQSNIDDFNAKHNIGYESLSFAIERHLSKYFEAHNGDLPSSGLYERVLKEVERPLIKLSLSATGGNQLQAAKMLGLNRNTLRKKIRDLNLEVVRGLKKHFDRSK